MKIIFFIRKPNEKNLLNINKIPATLNNNKNIILIKLNNNNFLYEKLKKNLIIKAKLLNKYFEVIIKDINYHYYKKLIFHIDFLLINNV